MVQVFACTTLNKNWESLQKRGIQKKARYPPAASYIHEKTKLGVIIGSVIRIETQNTTEHGLLRSQKEMLFEMKAIGYDLNFLMRALHKVQRRAEWRGRVTKLLSYIRTMLVCSS